MPRTACSISRFEKIPVAADGKNYPRAAALVKVKRPKPENGRPAPGPSGGCSLSPHLGLPQATFTLRGMAYFLLTCLPSFNARVVRRRSPLRGRRRARHERFDGGFDGELSRTTHR